MTRQEDQEKKIALPQRHVNKFTEDPLLRADSGLRDRARSLKPGRQRRRPKMPISGKSQEEPPRVRESIAISHDAPRWIKERKRQYLCMVAERRKTCKASQQWANQS